MRWTAKPSTWNLERQQRGGGFCRWQGRPKGQPQFLAIILSITPSTLVRMTCGAYSEAAAYTEYIIGSRDYCNLFIAW